MSLQGEDQWMVDDRGPGKGMLKKAPYECSKCGGTQRSLKRPVCQKCGISMRKRGE